MSCVHSNSPSTYAAAYRASSVVCVAMSCILLTRNHGAAAPLPCHSCLCIVLSCSLSPSLSRSLSLSLSLSKCLSVSMSLCLSLSVSAYSFVMCVFDVLYTYQFSQHICCSISCFICGLCCDVLYTANKQSWCCSTLAMSLMSLYTILSFSHSLSLSPSFPM
jgi:hypothetical protein